VLLNRSSVAAALKLTTRVCAQRWLAETVIAVAQTAPLKCHSCCRGSSKVSCRHFLRLRKLIGHGFQLWTAGINAYVVGSTERSLGGPYSYDMFIRKMQLQRLVLWAARQLNF